MYAKHPRCWVQYQGKFFIPRKSANLNVCHSSPKFRGGKFPGHLTITLPLQESELRWLIRIGTLGLETKNGRLRIVEILPRVKRSEQTRLRQFPSRKSWKTRFLWAYRKKKIEINVSDPHSQCRSGSSRPKSTRIHADSDLKTLIEIRKR